MAEYRARTAVDESTDAAAGGEEAGVGVEVIADDAVGVPDPTQSAEQPHRPILHRSEHRHPHENLKSSAKNRRLHVPDSAGSP